MRPVPNERRGFPGRTRFLPVQEEEAAPRKLQSPATLHASPGYSHLAIADGKRLVFVAGQVALDQDFEVVGGNDLTAPTTAAMRNVEAALAAAGAGFDHVVRRTIYTTRPTEWETISAAMAQVTGDSGDPPQTILGVTSLALSELLIEIEVTAVVDD